MGQLISYDVRRAESGMFLYPTTCPFKEGVKVGGNHCFRCKHFMAFVHRYPVLIAVECNHPPRTLEKTLFESEI